ncbi:hypothetical protein ACAG39_12135 [Caldicellulosiruptoraceae bacterium PP1]
MYRVFLESYNNYQKIYSNNKENAYRYKITEPFELIVNIDRFNKERDKNSFLYKKLCDLLFYMEKNIDRFPKFKAFLWTLESRNIKGKYYGVSSLEELEEQSKIINMFLNLQYWQ